MYIFILIPAISSLVSFLVFRNLTPKLREEEITGEDKHKSHRPDLPEMGGLAIASGFTAGILSVVGFNQFAGRLMTLNLTYVFAAGLTVLIVALIGMVDDLLQVRQLTKALMPALAALPLVAVKVGKTFFNLPFVGHVDVGLLYPTLLVPLGVTGAANAVNMLAGFNGLETGLGVIMMGALGYVSWSIGAWTAFFILICGLGATLVIFYFNWFPAEVLIGDTGTLTIGAIVATAVIVGDFEYAGVILIIPFVVDFLLKASSGLPKSFAEEEEGKLYCPGEKPTGLAQLVLKVSGGMTEKWLVATLLGIEVVFAVLAVLYYV